MDGTLWMYVALALTTAPPLVPNAALVASAGALAQAGELSLPLVLFVVATAATAGDAAVYGLGRLGGGRARSWLARDARRRAALAWAGDRMRVHGLPFVIAVRFVPSGRLLGGLTAALVGYPARRYLLGAAIAQCLWAGYSVALGYWGGGALGGVWAAMAVGWAVSLLAAALAHLVARRLSRSPRPAPAGARRGAAGGVPDGAPPIP
ncbi:VTT domain-containing protein [Streptomyces marincola]|uniref:VTT domain-containing protein n=1 Tax=Streptomyces marincola TaxID=2878388 RepID=UPI001CF2C3BB|nr:VTT domain-containing protein [Streptomyces marincola]UCM88280.1 VTT domain-containing protein [Streptomyces marincola]